MKRNARQERRASGKRLAGAFGVSLLLNGGLWYLAATSLEHPVAPQTFPEVTRLHIKRKERRSEVQITQKDRPRPQRRPGAKPAARRERPLTFLPVRQAALPPILHNRPDPTAPASNAGSGANGRGMGGAGGGFMPRRPSGYRIAIPTLPASRQVFLPAPNPPSGTEPEKPDAEHITPPVPILQVDPEIPNELKNRPFRASVKVLAKIETDGTFTVALKRSTGDTDIDECVLTALQRWKWQPALRDGKPVRFDYTFPYAFSVN